MYGKETHTDIEIACFLCKGPKQINFTTENFSHGFVTLADYDSRRVTVMSESESEVEGGIRVV